MRVGLTILTHVPEGAARGVLNRLPAALASLKSSCQFTDMIAIFDDGSTHEEHRKYLRSLGSNVIHGDRCRGIARAKNACLKILQVMNIDLGFIAEDDIEFKPGWCEAYVEAHKKTGIQHFSWAWNSGPNEEMWKCHRFVNGYEIVQTSRVNGVLLSLTPEVIRRVGGFKVLPGPRWGHEHTNWTKRIIKAGLSPYFCDIVDSNRFIGLNQYAGDSTVSLADKERFSRINEAAANELEPIYLPLEE